MLDLRPKWTRQMAPAARSRSTARELACQEEQPEALLPFNGWRRKVGFFDTLPQLGAHTTN